MKIIFGGLVFISLALCVMWFSMPWAAEYLYDYEALGGLQWSGFGAQLSSEGMLPYVFGVLYVLATIGLLLFKSWGRTLFLVLAISNVVLIPFMGLSVQGSYDATLSYLLTLTDGAILALAYLSSVGQEFRHGT